MSLGSSWLPMTIGLADRWTTTGMTGHIITPGFDCEGLTGPPLHHSHHD